VHHLLQEGGERFTGLSHDIFNLVAQLLVHSLFELNAVDGATIVDDDVLAIVSVVKHKFELCQIAAADQLVVMLLTQEALLECSQCSFRISIVEIKV